MCTKKIVDVFVKIDVLGRIGGVLNCAGQVIFNCVQSIVTDRILLIFCQHPKHKGICDEQRNQNTEDKQSDQLPTNRDIVEPRNDPVS